MATKVQLIAVQMHWNISQYQSPESFEKKIRSLMEQAAEIRNSDIPALVVFPEDVGTPLLFTEDYAKLEHISSLQQAVGKLLLRNIFPILRHTVSRRVGFLRSAMLTKAVYAGQIYTSVFSRIAREYGVYLIAGSASLPDWEIHADSGEAIFRMRDGNIYNVSYFFGPDGRIIGTQKKTHLVPGLEDKAGFNFSSSSPSSLKVFDTEFGKIGIAICLDCFQESVVRMLADMGAHILVQPSANAGPWSPWQQEDWMRSSWEAVHRDPRFIASINPMMTGKLFDLSFEGQSSIVSFQQTTEVEKKAYHDLSPREGFLAVAKSSDAEELLSAVVEVP